MDWEELDPRKKPVERRNLETMGIAELEAYIGDLESEILRARAAIESKKGARAGAESFFKR